MSLHGKNQLEKGFFDFLLTLGFVHVLKNGQIIKSGDFELAKELEKVGYEDFN